jgi:carbon monoxide dehydrogenase subunit G
MKIAGNATLQATPERVYAALNDPAVLVRTIPGCQQLEPVGQDSYKMTITAGVASIKGVYQGEVALSDQQAPDSFRLKASGAGAPGTVSADVLVKLTDAGNGTTRLEYDADAVVGGMVGGVGQRMLTGVAKKTAGEFFKAVDGVLTGAPPAPAKAAANGQGAPAAAAQPGAAAAPATFTAPSAPALAGAVSGDFAKGAVFGAVIALLGALVGGLLARRR